jgi:hypothetical protein
MTDASIPTDAIDTLGAWVPDDALPGELARALGERRYAALPELARRTARCVLADPTWSRNELAPVFVSVDELVFSLRPATARVAVPAEALIAIVDLIDAIECIGGPLRSTCSVIARSWLGDLGGIAGLERLRVAMAAFAWNDLIIAHRHLGVADVTAGYDRAAAYSGDLGAAIRHVMGAAQAGDKMFAVEPMLESVVLAARELGLDEPTLLWLARLVFHDVGGAGLGEVAAKAHGFVRDVLADRAARSTAEEPRFPVGATLAGGTYRIDDHVAGEGFQRLYLGRRVRDGASVLIAMDMASKHDPAQLEVGVCRARARRRLASSPSASRAARRARDRDRARAVGGKDPPGRDGGGHRPRPRTSRVHVGAVDRRGSRSGRGDGQGRRRDLEPERRWRRRAHVRS